MSSSGERRLAPASAAACLCVLLGAASARSQDFERRVNAAIHRGRAALLPRLAAEVESPPKEQAMGHIALSLAACLKSQVPPANDVVKRAMEKLEAMEPVETYSVACYLVALDAYWQSLHGESIAAKKAGGDGDASQPVSRVPPDGPVRRKMQSLVSWLVRGEGGTWGYRGRAPGDLSNTQFAVLGLEIGLENEVEVPGEVFRAVAEHLLRAHRTTGPPVSLGIVYRTPAWEGVTRGTTRSATLKTAPGGWNYTFDASAPPSQTMTAAGVSSLLVARRALVKAGEYDSVLAKEVDGQVEAGLAWIGSSFGTFLAACPNQLYGLYSVEKVGDIGSLQALGKIDWYAEGAKLLLRTQKANGTWGTEAGTDVESAFALLFLTRATRSHDQTLGPLVVLTGSGAPGAKDDGGDLVFVSKLGGFVSAAALLGFLAETRDPAMLPLAEEAEKALPPHKVHQVFGLLLPLWTDDDDAITKHARSSLESIAGIRGGDRGAFEALRRGLQRLRELERAGAATGAEAAELLDSSESPLLARRALDFIDRLVLLEAFPSVISKLTSTDPDVRRRAREVLALWAGDRAPPVHAEDPPLTVASTWRDWWAREGVSFVASRRAAKLIEEIDRAKDAVAEDAAARGLSKLGEIAVPLILRAMERGEYSIHLVRVLEAITGKVAGVRAEDWKKQLGIVTR